MTVATAPDAIRPVRWPCPGGGDQGDWALAADRGRPHRILIVPPLFDEMNRCRHMLVDLMRRLDAAGIDSLLPDLPGCGESLQDFADQSLGAWRGAMAAAARHFAATHALSLRGGALVVPTVLPGWTLEPSGGHAILRTMLRAASMAARAAGQPQTTAQLLEAGRERGLELAGYPCSAALIAGLHGAEPANEGHAVLALSDLGQPAPWLRSEPAPAPALAEALARTLADRLAA